jgi:hypothetical protein
MTQFYDSATWQDIPDGATHVALYADGTYAVPAGASVRRIPHRRWITVTGHNHYAGIADFEQGNPVYETQGELRRWAIGHLAQSTRVPIVYCDRADLHLAVAEMNLIPHYWWIPTLDNHEWTAEDLAVNIWEEFHIHIPHDRIWANQFTDHKDEYDVSNLFLRWDL